MPALPHLPRSGTSFALPALPKLASILQRSGASETSSPTASLPSLASLARRQAATITVYPDIRYVPVSYGHVRLTSSELGGIIAGSILGFLFLLFLLYWAASPTATAEDEITTRTRVEKVDGDVIHVRPGSHYSHRSGGGGGGRVIIQEEDIVRAPVGSPSVASSRSDEDSPEYVQVRVASGPQNAYWRS